MATKTVRQLRQLASEFTASIDEDAFLDGTLIVDAPPLTVWNANHCHSISVPFNNHHGHRWLREAATDVYSQMQMGISPCDNPDCDVCEEYRDEARLLP